MNPNAMMHSIAELFTNQTAGQPIESGGVD